jgi:hypothetical protein
MVRLFVLFVACALLFAGCFDDEKAIENVANQGTIVFNDFEGGFYGIEGDNGTKYDPTNLPKEFETVGMRVTFTGVIRKDMMSTHMWGEILEITKIDPLVEE